jgi:hypothetical protein
VIRPLRGCKEAGKAGVLGSRLDLRSDLIMVSSMKVLLVPMAGLARTTEVGLLEL